MFYSDKKTGGNICITFDAEIEDQSGQIFSRPMTVKVENIPDEHVEWMAEMAYEYFGALIGEYVQTHYEDPTVEELAAFAENIKTDEMN